LAVFYFGEAAQEIPLWMHSNILNSIFPSLFPAFRRRKT